MEYGGKFLKKMYLSKNILEGTTYFYPLLTYDKLGIKARIICYVDTDRGDGSEIYTRHGSYSRKIYIMRLLVIA